MQKEEYNITHINLFRVDQPLIKPYKLSYNTFHSFEPLLVQVIDNHGNVASQSVNFNITPNEAPKFRINSTAGTIISSPYTASINEDETAFTQSFFYSDSNAEDTITINSTSPEPFNSYWDIHNISAQNKIEIRQKAQIAIRGSKMNKLFLYRKYMLQESKCSKFILFFT